MVDFRLATVTGFFEDGTAMLQFYGEDAPSEKRYPYLAGYVPIERDKVFAIPFAESYVIIGKMLYAETSSGGNVTYITAEDLGAALTKYASKDHTHSGYAAASHTHANYAATSHAHHRLTNPEGRNQVGYYYSNGNAFSPMSTQSLGENVASRKWSVVYANTATISTSDREQKKNINAPDGRYEDFFAKLKPVLYQLKVNESDRIHAGFIAQDVYEAMETAGITSREFAGYIKTPVYEDEETEEGLKTRSEAVNHYEYGLRYEEFIPLNTMMIQKLQERVDMLEQALTAKEEEDA